MRALVQRVSEGAVEVTEKHYRQEIQNGMVILLGVKQGDTKEDMEFVADKCCSLRIFDDTAGRMNLSLKDTGGEVLIISQFTLYGETRKGNRPNFMLAAEPKTAVAMYEMFVERVKTRLGADRVKTGIFGAMMSVKIINDGPVTVMVESK